MLAQLHAVSDGILAFDQLVDSGALVDAAVQLDNCCGRLDSAVQHVTSSALPFLLPAPLAPALSGAAGLFSDVASAVPRSSGGGGGGAAPSKGYSADDFVRAIEALRCAVDRRAARLRAVVVSCWQRGVVVEGREVRVAKALPLGAAGVAPAELTASAPGRALRSAGGSGEVTLSDVLVAAVQAGVLVDCVAPLAARLRERVLDPVVAGSVDVMVAAAGLREAVLECLPLPPPGPDDAAAPAAPLAIAAGRVRAAVEFLRLHAFAPVAGGSATPEATAGALSLAFALLGSCVWYGPHLVSVCASSAAAIDAVSLAAAVASEPPPPVLMLGTPPGGAASLRLPPASAALWGHDTVSIAPSGLPVPHALGPGDAATSLLQEQPPRLNAPRLADWPRAHAAPATPERGSGATQQQLHLAWAWGQLEGSLRVGLSRLLTPGGGAPDSAWGLLHALLRLCASGVPGGPPDSSSAGSGPESRAAGAAAAEAEAALEAVTGGGAGGALAAYRRDVLRPAAELEAWLHERGFVASAEEGLQSLAAAGELAGSAHHSHHVHRGVAATPGTASAQHPSASGAALLRPLAAALEDAEELYAYRLRVAVLSAARAACLGDYHNSAVVRGVDENAGINSAMAALLRPSAEDAESAPAPLAGSIGETLLGWVTGSEVPPPTVAGTTSSAPGDHDTPDFESLLFRLPTCQVSAVALQLVRLAQAAMAAAEAAAAAHRGGELSLHTAWVLFRSAKDALGLLPAVVPLRCGPVISTSPRLAMLLHNDCLFLAHHAVLLGWRYANVLVPTSDSAGTTAEAAVPVPVTFVDLLPMLRAMAQRALLGQVRTKSRDAYLRISLKCTCIFSNLQVRKARASVTSAFTDAAGGWTLARVAEDALAIGGDDDDASSAAWAVALEGAAKAQVIETCRYECSHVIASCPACGPFRRYGTFSASLRRGAPCSRELSF